MILAEFLLIDLFSISLTWSVNILDINECGLLRILSQNFVALSLAIIANGYLPSFP